jgi:hypothetical protein
MRARIGGRREVRPLMRFPLPLDLRDDGRRIGVMDAIPCPSARWREVTLACFVGYRPKSRGAVRPPDTE